MDKKIIVNLSKNHAFSYSKYATIVEDLEKNSEGKPMSEVINGLISDIINRGKEGYTNKTESVSLEGLTPAVADSLVKYLRIKKKEYEKTEKQEKKKEKANQIEAKWEEFERTIDGAILSGEQGSELEILAKLMLAVKDKTIEYEFDNKERKEILKRLKNRLDNATKEAEEIEEKRKQEEEKRKAEEAKLEEKRRQEEVAAEEKRKQEEAKTNAEAAMNKIQEISEREYKSGNIDSRLAFLNKIRDAITGESAGIDLGAKMGEASQEHLLKILDGKIKDEVYYEQVKAYTNNFEFLRDYPEFVKADHGAKERKKFTDFEAHSRFCDLASALEEISYDENTAIQQMLSTKNISEIDKRILIERREILEKQMERKRQQEEGIR